MSIQLIIKKQLRSLTKSQCVAIAILAFTVASSLYVVLLMLDWNKSNRDLQKSRTFHITFFYYFSGQSLTPAGTIPDIRGDLTLYYQRGTLIVDDPVRISGLAIVNPAIPQHVVSITFHFQNALAYPVTQTASNITDGSDLILHQTENSSVLTGSATMTWTLEGEYNPYLAVTFDNSTGRYGTPLAVSRDVAITVYPKSQFAQIITNSVSIILAWTVYLPTLVGTGNLVLSLWDRELHLKKDKNDAKMSDSNTNIRVARKPRGTDARMHEAHL